MAAEQARRTFQIVVAATKQWGIGKGALGVWGWALLNRRRRPAEPTAPTARPDQ